ncbi:MAG: DoxX family membrane protein [Dehalococcoidaceae bacterium]|nr:DoxX family membrane protein [Dehalococcoidaceae bacterium]
MEKVKAFLNSGKLTLVLRILIGVMILYAELPKLPDVEKLSVFALYSYQFPWLMPWMEHTRILGYMAPYLGTLLGLGLITGVLTRLSAFGWGTMAIIFIILKLHVIFIQGRIQPCYCFPGPLANLLVTQTLAIDIITLPLLAQIMLAKNRKFFTLGALLPERWQHKLRYIW